MPNHCSNSLHLDGDFKHRQEFVDKNKGFAHTDTDKTGEYKNLSYHAQVPLPQKHIKSHDKDRSNTDWYSWCNKNWGTKWDTYEEELTHEKGYTYYSFESAWGSPREWVQKVSRKFPNLKFNITWAEEGGCGGRYMFHGGDCFYETSMSDAEWREYQGYEDEDN
jgi:hypothetical protein|tara:strand:- start:218 stop:709 length:492 start_codon:yes stop_codon:yes gene_type:complete